MAAIQDNLLKENAVQFRREKLEDALEILFEFSIQPFLDSECLLSFVNNKHLFAPGPTICGKCSHRAIDFHVPLQLSDQVLQLRFSLDHIDVPLRIVNQNMKRVRQVIPAVLVNHARQFTALCSLDSRSPLRGIDDS